MPSYAPKSSLGVLRLTATNQALEYRAFELSSCTLGIIAQQPLSPKDYLMLENPGLRIPLRVIDSARGNAAESDHRYRLMCLDSNLQLDQVCLRHQGGSSKASFQYARFSLQPKLYVEVKNLLTHTTQLMETVNISRTGMLLKTQASQASLRDFALNSQVWTRLDIGHLWLPQTLEPRAQVVRTYLDKVAGQTYGFLGLQFISFTGPEATLWNELLSRLERSELPGSACVRPAFDPHK